MSRPTRADRAGQVYLDLQRRARQAGRGTQEFLVRYALERFLYRLVQTPWRNRLILKGGMLLAVYDVRRATQDIDMAARALDNEEQELANWLRDVFTVEVDDGVVFDTGSLRVEVIREGDPYPGIRIDAEARLATAKIPLKVDVNFGDPIVPGPATVSYPSLLGKSFNLLAYPLVSVLGEKVETMVRRGDANTRERDFSDVWLLTRMHSFDASEFRAALEATATFRGTVLVPLRQALTSYGQMRQSAWSNFVDRAGLVGTVPEQLEGVLRGVAAFAEPDPVW